MVNVVLKKVAVSSVNELVVVIKKNLMRCKSTQIYVSSKLMRKLIEQNRSKIIWEENITDSIQYSENFEKAIIFYVIERNKTETFQIHYVEDNLEYIKICFFASKGILYRNYNSAMKEVLIICPD